MPTSRLAISLLLALAIWFPTCLASMDGAISVDVALIRYLIAFFVARLGVGFVGSLVARYHEANTHNDTGVAPSPKGHDGMDSGDGLLA